MVLGDDWATANLHAMYIYDMSDTVIIIIDRLVFIYNSSFPHSKLLIIRSAYHTTILIKRQTINQPRVPSQHL